MKILIPNKNIPKATNSYTHAHETLEMRVYYEREYIIYEHSKDWVHFDHEINPRTNIKSFYLTDFHVLDSEDISPLERIIYGI